MRAEKYLWVTPPQEQKHGLAPAQSASPPSVQPETRVKGCRVEGQGRAASDHPQPRRTEPNSVQTDRHWIQASLINTRQGPGSCGAPFPVTSLQLALWGQGVHCGRSRVLRVGKRPGTESLAQAGIGALSCFESPQILFC